MLTTRQLFSDLSKGNFVNWTRTIVDFSKHYEPKHLRWQWTPRRCPKVECPDLCVPRKCPKVKWYQKRKSVPVDIVVGPPKKAKKSRSLKDIFGLLAPTKKVKPPLYTCRRLLQMRINNCVDPFRSPQCFRVECDPCEFTEWYGQAVMKTRALKIPLSKRRDSACLPPSYIVNRTIMCPPKKKPPVIDNPKPPFEQMLKDRARLLLSDFSDGSCLKQDKKPRARPCSVNIPDINYKHKRICQPKDKFKGVPCPHHLIQRYRSVKILRKTKLTPTPAGCSSGGYARWKIASLQPGVLRGTCASKSGARSVHGGRMFSTKPMMEPNIKEAENPSAPQEVLKPDLVPKLDEKYSFSNSDLAKKVFPMPSTPEHRVVFIEQRMSLQPSKQAVNTVKLVGCSVKTTFCESDYIKASMGPPIKFEYPKTIEQKEVGEVKSETARNEQPPSSEMVTKAKDTKLSKLKSKLDKTWGLKVEARRGFSTSACLGKKDCKKPIDFSLPKKVSRACQKDNEVNDSSEKPMNPYQKANKKIAPIGLCNQPRDTPPSSDREGRQIHTLTRQEKRTWLSLVRGDRPAFQGQLRLMSFPCKPGEGKDKGTPCPRRKNPCSEEKGPKKKKKKAGGYSPCDYIDPVKREKMTRTEPDPDPLKPKNPILQFSSIFHIISSFPSIKLSLPLFLSNRLFLNPSEALLGRLGFLCFSRQTGKGEDEEPPPETGKETRKEAGKEEQDETPECKSLDKKKETKESDGPPKERQISPCDYINPEIRKKLNKRDKDSDPNDKSDVKYAKTLLATSLLISTAQRAFFSTNERQGRRGFQYEGDQLPDYINPGNRKGIPVWEEDLIVPNIISQDPTQPGLLFFKWRKQNKGPEADKKVATPAPKPEPPQRFSPCDYINPEMRKKMEMSQNAPVHGTSPVKQSTKPYKVCFLRKLVKKTEVAPKPPPPAPKVEPPVAKKPCVPLDKIVEKDKIVPDSKVEAPLKESIAPAQAKTCKVKNPCDIHKIKRESCFCPTKDPKVSFFCRIAQFFGIGCGRKDKESN